MKDKTFRRNGYVIWSALSPNPYLASAAQWTDDLDSAHIFVDLNQAIASCDHWAYFAASSGLEVIEVKQGKHLFEDGTTVYRS
jgi:hypothetical protein